jgi:hypothetical protein
MNSAKSNYEKHPDDKKTSAGIVNQMRDTKRVKRRYLDAFKSTGRALNLDRRETNRDRRLGLVPDYQGFSRREIIDRRENLEDRRE